MRSLVRLQSRLPSLDSLASFQEYKEAHRFHIAPRAVLDGRDQACLVAATLQEVEGHRVARVRERRQFPDAHGAIGEHFVALLVWRGSRLHNFTRVEVREVVTVAAFLDERLALRWKHS